MNKKLTIVQLTVRMGIGYGTSVVVEELTKQFVRYGHRVIIGCEEKAETNPDLDVRVVEPTPEALRALAEDNNADIVIAHSTPFFELLPWMKPFALCFCWEHGDPSPDFFPYDAQERVTIKDHKQRFVYPAVDGVIAISEFIRNNISWPKSIVIYNGIDYVPDWGPKESVGSRRLRIGTLMRLGKGENFYKGSEEFLELVARCQESINHELEFFVAGKGTIEDARIFEKAGIKTLRNISDHDKHLYLRNLDVFVSCSLWEGFNLPLAEAQALGTVGLAFDMGAHPEVTPYLCSRYEDAIALIERFVDDPEFLCRASSRCYRFVRNRFQWVIAAERFLELVGQEISATVTDSGHPKFAVA